MDMLLETEFKKRKFKIHPNNYFDLSCPTTFDNAQVRAYGANFPTKVPYQAGSFIGDVSKGGACNCFVVELNPHCNTTHTETVGHILENEQGMNTIHLPPFIPASVLPISIVYAKDTSETYNILLNAHDLLITKKEIENALKNADQDFIEALIIYSPDGNHCNKMFDEFNSPFFSTEAILFIQNLGVKHIILESASVDRISDDGKLNNHRIFFGYPNHYLPKHFGKTITEMACIANKLPKQLPKTCFLQINYLNWHLDVSPSRPLLFTALEI